jgi:uncharacterized membrane protein YeaQ/YmgE (transglycosylase-associated protein family)
MQTFFAYFACHLVDWSSLWGLNGKPSQAGKRRTFIFDMIIGVVGAVIGSLVFQMLGFYTGTGVIAKITAAALGAILLLVTVKLVKRR